MTVVDLDQYRAQSSGTEFDVTFMAALTTTPEGQELKLTFTIRTQDPLGLIDDAKANGGIFNESPDDNVLWFIPWPCAAVRVRPVGL